MEERLPNGTQLQLVDGVWTPSATVQLRRSTFLTTDVGLRAMW